MSIRIDMKELLEAGAHFGHKTSRWHPKMAEYIHSKRQDTHIINLEKTVAGIEHAIPAIEKVIKDGKKVLFVGTKKQLKALVKEVAESVEMPYVTERWIKDLERRMKSGELEARYSKLEVQRFQEEIDMLNTRYGGIKDMTEQPSLVIVTDACEDKNAIKEARTLNIPVIAICDTNVDPSDINFVIPANDDSTKAEKLILGYFVEAIKEAKK